MPNPKNLTFEELYAKIVIATETRQVDASLRKLKYDPHHLECILRPTLPGAAVSCAPEKGHCPGKNFLDCLFDSLKQDETGKWQFALKSTLCQERIDVTKIPDLLASKDLIATLLTLKKGDRPVYAAIAPAFLSQFEGLDDGKIRAAFKRLGFAGMIEVSLFADILTLKEALEFDAKIHHEGDYMLTSCCCPTWISMIRHMHPHLLEKIPASVSPMIASGRVIKHLIPGAAVVFVGPCLAKKNEAKEPDIADAIDHVLTFRETKTLFDVARINPETLEPDLREHSSYAGRIYAVTKGVSESVRLTLNRVRPDKEIKVKAMQADGTPACKALLNDLENGVVKANFIEGMGCVGGCVGGPRALIDKEVAAEHVRAYAKKSLYKTPIDNPYVVELLHRLGIHTIEALLEDQKYFTRHFLPLEQK